MLHFTRFRHKESKRILSQREVLMVFVGPLTDQLVTLRAGLQEFRFQRATTREEVLVHRTVRSEWFGSAGYITPEQAASLDDDGRDPYSIHFLAYKDNEVVGCSRVTLPTAPLWYIDQYCTLPPPAYDRQVTGEIARQGVAPDYRHDQRASSLIQLGLIREMVRLHETDGLELLLTGVHRRYFHRLCRLLRSYRLPCDELLGATIKGELEGYEGYLENNPDPIVLMQFELRRYVSLLSTY